MASHLSQKDLYVISRLYLVGVSVRGCVGHVSLDHGGRVSDRVVVGDGSDGLHDGRGVGVVVGGDGSGIVGGIGRSIGRRIVRSGHGIGGGYVCG